MTTVWDLTVQALAIRTAIMREDYIDAGDKARELQATLEDLDDEGVVLVQGENNA